MRIAARMEGPCGRAISGSHGIDGEGVCCPFLRDQEFEPAVRIGSRLVHVGFLGDVPRWDPGVPHIDCRNGDTDEGAGDGLACLARQDPTRHSGLEGVWLGIPDRQARGLVRDDL